MRNLRHVVAIHRPTKAKSDEGHGQGSPTTLFRNVPCAIEQLASVEDEVAGNIIARSTYRVTDVWLDPKPELKHHDYLLRQDGRQLNIVQIDGEQANGEKLTLICGERHDP